MDSAAVAAAVPYQLRQLEFPTRDKEGPKNERTILSSGCDSHSCLYLTLWFAASTRSCRWCCRRMRAFSRSPRWPWGRSSRPAQSHSSSHRWSRRAFPRTFLSLAGAATSIKNMLVATNILSWQKRCHDKRTFVETKHVFCHNKSMLVATTLLLWQNYVCCDKRFVMTSILLAASAKYTVLVVFLCFLLDVSIGWGKMGRGGGLIVEFGEEPSLTIHPS